MPPPFRDRRHPTRRAAVAMFGAAVVASDIPGRRAQAIPMNGENFARLSAAQAAAQIRRGEITAERFAEALIERLPDARRLNALTQIDPAKVLEDARRVDKARAAGKRLGLLAGVPLVFKDNIDTIGYATTAGTRILEHFRPGDDAGVAARLFGEGAILLAKANMHELAGGGTSSNPVFGPVRNPYDVRRVSGGSSGGTAAAISVGFAPAGLGSDTAGSVRIPAAFCGIAGLRPTSVAEARRYPLDGIVPLAARLDTAGPMARSVADVALLDAAITGQRLPRAARLASVRLGLPVQFYWEDADDKVVTVARAAVEKLKGVGVTFVPVDISSFVDGAHQIFAQMILAGVRDDLAIFLKDQKTGLSRADVANQIASRDTYALFAAAAGYADAMTPGELDKALRSAIASYRATLDGARVDALCFPTMIAQPPLIEEDGDGPRDVMVVAGKSLSKANALVRNTRPICALGGPALSLPCGLDSDGLPVGLELEARPGDDKGLLSIGKSIERVLGSIPRPTPNGT